MTLSSMGNMQNNALLTDEKKNQMAEAFAKRNQEVGQQMFAAGVKRARKIPVALGLAIEYHYFPPAVVLRRARPKPGAFLCPKSEIEPIYDCNLRNLEVKWAVGRPEGL